MSENMHYEIFKYLDSKDLLEIRATKLGGYQLTSNKLLRSRIQNYFPKLRPLINHSNKLKQNKEFLELVLQQTGGNILSFDGLKMGVGVINLWMPILKLIPQLKGINLGSLNLYIYIYILTHRKK